jgi:hypothetical protein
MMGWFSSKSEGSEESGGSKREIHRGKKGGGSAEQSKKGHGTRKVRAALKADAKARKAQGETRDKRGNRGISGGEGRGPKGDE